MRVYIDMCCLKRLFDDQTQSRIHLESEAVIALLALPLDQVEFVHAPAHDLENEKNSRPERAARVADWLTRFTGVNPSEEALVPRTAELMALGFKNIDAVHLASAEAAAATIFLTCDDRLLAAAARHAASLRLRVLGPLDLAREVLP